MVNKRAVTLLLGSEATLRDRFLQSLRADLFKDPGAASLNEHYWDASKAELSDLLTHAQTAPFLAGHRLIIIDHVNAVKPSDQKILLKTLRENSGGAVWALMTDESGLKTAWLKSLAALGESVNCSGPFWDSEVRGWIVKRFRESGKSCDAATADRILSRVGKGMTLLELAIQRLLIYRADAPAVTVRDVEALLGSSAEENAFEVLSAMKTRGAGEALRMVRALRAEGLKATDVLTPILFQFEQLLRVKNCLTLGLGAADLPGRVPGIKSAYRANQAAELARRVSAGRIASDLRALIDCEAGIKRGELDETEALERCVLSLSDTVEAER